MLLAPVRRHSRADMQVVQTLLAKMCRYVGSRPPICGPTTGPGPKPGPAGFDGRAEHVPGSGPTTKAPLEDPAQAPKAGPACNRSRFSAQRARFPRAKCEILRARYTFIAGKVGYARAPGREGRGRFPPYCAAILETSGRSFQGPVSEIPARCGDYPPARYCRRMKCPSWGYFCRSDASQPSAGAARYETELLRFLAGGEGPS
jgi:hypothetical protein